MKSKKIKFLSARGLVLQSILACNLAFMIATSVQAGSCDGLTGQPKGLCTAAVQMSCEVDPSLPGCEAVSRNWEEHCSQCTGTPPWQAPAISLGCQELNDWVPTGSSGGGIAVTLNAGEIIHAEVTGTSSGEGGWALWNIYGPTVDYAPYVLLNTGQTGTAFKDFTVAEDGLHQFVYDVTGPLVDAFITCTAN